MSHQEVTAAAWAPWVDFHSLDAGVTTAEDERDWLKRRDELASAWVLARGQRDRRGVVLRVPSHADEYRTGPFREVAKRGVIITNRGRRSAGGSTLVPLGYPREIADAMIGANHAGIVVTEHPAWPLEGWAMALGALNLRTLQPTVDQRTDEQREDLEHLAAMLCNGWSSEPGRRAASQLLPKLSESGMSWTIFYGSILATHPTRFDEKAIKKHAPRVWHDDMAMVHASCLRRL